MTFFRGAAGSFGEALFLKAVVMKCRSFISVTITSLEQDPRGLILDRWCSWWWGIPGAPKVDMFFWTNFPMGCDCQTLGFGKGKRWLNAYCIPLEDE